MRSPAVQTTRNPELPEGANALRGLREVGMPQADAGVRRALRSAYAPPSDLPSEFASLLARLR